MIDITLFRDRINPYFEGFVRETEPVDTREQFIRDMYLDPDGRRLVGRCQQHIRQFRSPTEKSGLVVIVHPFYNLFKFPEHYLGIRDYQPKVNDTTESTCQLIANLDRENNNLVLFESPEHYARFSSWLLEAGLVDDVVLTRADSGNPLTFEGMECVANKRGVFVGGEYADYCVKNGVEMLLVFVPPKKLFYIQEALLPSPALYLTPGQEQPNWMRSVGRVSVSDLCKSSVEAVGHAQTF